MMVLIKTQLSLSPPQYLVQCLTQVSLIPNKCWFLFGFIKTRAWVEELHKATVPFSDSSCQEETCHKDLCTFWQGFPTSYYYFFYFLWKKIQYTTFFSVLFFYFKGKKKSLKCHNMIIKIWCFCSSFIVPIFTSLTTKVLT